MTNHIASLFHNLSFAIKFQLNDSEFEIELYKQLKGLQVGKNALFFIELVKQISSQNCNPRQQTQTNYTSN